MTVEKDKEIKRILQQAGTIAVIGLSARKERDSYRVAMYLREHGYRIIPVNPTYQGQEVLGEKVRGSLQEVDEPVDIVNVFRKPEGVPEVAEAAIRKKVPVVWLQLGVVNRRAIKKMEKHGIKVVVDRCIKVEHARLLGD